MGKAPEHLSLALVPLALVLLVTSSSAGECPGVTRCMHFSADAVLSADQHPRVFRASSIGGCQETCRAQGTKFFRFRPESSINPAQCTCFDQCTTIAAGFSTVGVLASCDPDYKEGYAKTTHLVQETDKAIPSFPPPSRGQGGRAKKYGPCTIRFPKCPPRCPGKSICLRDGQGASCCCVGLTPAPMIFGGKLRDCTA